MKGIFHGTLYNYEDGASDMATDFTIRNEPNFVAATNFKKNLNS